MNKALFFGLLLVVALFASASSPASGEDGSDLILRHGVFYPVASPTPIHGSLVVRNGRISFLGDDAGALTHARPGARVIELAGKAVTPGLIDAHSHLVGLGDALVEVDLVATSSFEEVIARVHAAAAGRPSGTWIAGRGWDQNDWPERSFPTHERLSAALPDHPVWLTRVDGHAALLNARAMTVLGIGPAVVDPPGGRFERDGAGRPTGVLIDRAMDVAAQIPAPDAAERQRRLAAAAARAVAVGLTTVTDMGVGPADIEAYRALTKAGRLPLRAALFLTDDAELLADWFARGPEIDPAARLLVRGVKLYADGALGSRGAALVEPYSDDPSNLGLLTASHDHLADVARRALAAGFQVGIHAIGDRGNLVTLDAIEAAFGGRPRPELRWRLEHAQVMRLADIERTARLGVIFSVQPTHATSDMPWAGDRVGERRLAGAYAWRKALVAGGQLALGSDFPVESVEPLLGLYAAVSRQDRAGAPAGGWLPEERLTRHEALRGFTLDAARSLFLDTEVGTLDIGKRADLVVFDRDPMTVPVAEIPNVRPVLTLVEGQVVYAAEVR
ncbi:MAG: amidohydrolase [Thermoanaerobaculia bacterium]|nr:amidohydrolase [Thermoanaerobaculia bacterium]